MFVYTPVGRVVRSCHRAKAALYWRIFCPSLLLSGPQAPCRAAVVLHPLLTLLSVHPAGSAAAIGPDPPALSLSRPIRRLYHRDPDRAALLCSERGVESDFYLSGLLNYFLNESRANG